MKRCTLNEVGKIFRVVHCGQYVVLIGGRLWIFTESGNLIVYKKDIVNPGRIVQLPSDRILVECGKNGAYILLSLPTGEELHRFALPPMDLPVSPLVLSPDGSYVYGCYEYKTKYYCLRINTTTWVIETSLIAEDGLFALEDIICDPEGKLCVLEQHYEENESGRISVNRIRKLDETAFLSGRKYEQNTWILPFPKTMMTFMCNSETVLTDDLFIYNLSDQSRINLLENEVARNRPKERFFAMSLSQDRKYVILAYYTNNIVISLDEKKIVAQYNAEYKIGSLINGTYWIPDEEGVKQKKFPCLEEIMPLKHHFWKP